MIQNPFRKQPIRERKNNCKIKFKKTATGTQTEISPECTKEQIELAKQNQNSDI